MKRLILILFFQIIVCNLLMSQDLDDLSFGTENSLEIVTWNIEQFPKNDETTINYVINIIEALDVDLLAIQEVNDIDAFNQMMDDLNAYEGYLESLFFAGLAYIYKPEVIQINDIYEIYTSSEYWNYFPRSPMVIDFNYYDERIIVINNHFKCCGDGFLDIANNTDEETRRYFASFLLKEYIDTYLVDENVVLLGDLNDDLVDATQDNVFQMILDDPENYLFADYDIAAGSSADWSFPSWPSHLDHISITNELFDDFEEVNSEIQTIKIDEFLPGGWSEYEANVSDHRPVGLKLSNSSLSSVEFDKPEDLFLNYPNPVAGETVFSFNATNSLSTLEVYNMSGQKISSLKIQPGQSSIRFGAHALSNGIYIAKLLSNNNVVTTRKLIVMK